MVGRRVTKAVGLYLSIILCLLAFVGCRGLRTYYWDYEGEWISDNPQVTLYKGCDRGEMTIDGIHYEFYTGVSNNASYIYFYIPENNDHQSEIYLWRANTTLKKDKLYLEITEDNISNYQGKTIVLTKKPLS